LFSHTRFPTPGVGKEWNMLLGDARQLPVEKKQHMLNHRERAIEKAIPRIIELLKG